MSEMGASTVIKRKHRKRFRFPGLEIYGVLIYLFLYMPLIVVLVYSFNSSQSAMRFQSLTLEWYQKLFSDSTLLLALFNSLKVSLIAVSCAVIIGTSGAIFLNRVSFKGKDLFRSIALMPIILPGIIIGLSILIFILNLKIPLSMFTVLLGHLTFTTAVVLQQVSARLSRLSKNLENAAMDLGAPPIKAFFYVTLPMIKRAIIGGALLAFTMSFDEIIITYFLTSTFTTLPIYIYGMLRFGLSPEIYAISAVVLVFSIVLIILTARFTGTEDEKLIS
ncbi:MAG: ABC transporter permease [Clostridia bacterium]|nr:ABC transporter permease [Clostridia bacterium]MDR3645628.1 ABC transporter permease [Clostridia bacterium]